MTYHVPCPHCEHLHELVRDNFHFRRDPETGYMTRAWFVCPACGFEIDEHHKPFMLADETMGGLARWVPSSAGDGETVSVTMSAYYMPIGALSWLSLARQLDRARKALEKGDHTLMRVYRNTREGLSYRDSETSTTVKQLTDRTEDFAMRIVPDRALVLTAAVDTQANRLEVQIEAWGPDMEHWVIDYQVLIGSPTEPPEQPGSVWARLDEIRRTPLVHASGRPIMISAFAIDSGGANTQDVYNYGSARKAQGCLVIRGSSRPNRPIISSAPTRVDIDWGGNKVEGGAELWQIGTDVAKDYLHNRLALHEGPGAMHLPRELPQDWFEQFLIEQPRTRYTKGRAIREWIKPNGARNEALDLSVYNLAVAYHLGLPRWSALDWKRLRDKLVPAHMTLDLFAPAPPLPLQLEDTAVDAIPEVSLSDALNGSPERVAETSLVQPAASGPVLVAPPAPVPAPMPAHVAAPPSITTAPSVRVPADSPATAQGGWRVFSKGIRR